MKKTEASVRSRLSHGHFRGTRLSAPGIELPPRSQKWIMLVWTGCRLLSGSFTRGCLRAQLYSSTPWGFFPVSTVLPSVPLHTGTGPWFYSSSPFPKKWPDSWLALRVFPCRVWILPLPWSRFIGIFYPSPHIWPKSTRRWAWEDLWLRSRPYRNHRLWKFVRLFLRISKNGFSWVLLSIFLRWGYLWPREYSNWAKHLRRCIPVGFNRTWSSSRLGSRKTPANKGHRLQLLCPDSPVCRRW